MDKRKVIYYENELEDEFSVAQITPRVIDGSYKYIHRSAFKRFTHFFWYRLVATPIAFLYIKLKFRHRAVGKEAFREFGKKSGKGYFMYGNHTQDIADAFIPNMINYPKTSYVIVHPNNVSMPFLGRVTPSMGALPLPDGMEAYRNFVKAVQTRAEEGNCVVIYPEAHIWPFYTGIRPFREDSFVYPVKLDMPVFCFTNTYKRRRWSKKPRIVTYIDGPFYPDRALGARERRKELRDRVYETMCRRARENEVEWIKYLKKDENDINDINDSNDSIDNGKERK